MHTCIRHVAPNTHKKTTTQTLLVHPLGGHDSAAATATTRGASGDDTTSSSSSSSSSRGLEAGPKPGSPLAWEPVGIALAAYALLATPAGGDEAEAAREDLPPWLRELLRPLRWVNGKGEGEGKEGALFSLLLLLQSPIDRPTETNHHSSSSSSTSSSRSSSSSSPSSSTTSAPLLPTPLAPTYAAQRLLAPSAALLLQKPDLAPLGLALLERLLTLLPPPPLDATSRDGGPLRCYAAVPPGGAVEEGGDKGKEKEQEAAGGVDVWVQVCDTWCCKV